MRVDAPRHSAYTGSVQNGVGWLEDKVRMLTQIDADRRLQIPDEWGEQFGPEQQVELVPCEEGMLVKPIRRVSLMEVYQRALETL